MVDDAEGFGEVVTDAEYELLAEALGAMGCVEAGDGPAILAVLAHAADAKVPGDRTATGRPMRSRDWFAAHGLGIARYAAHLHRLALRRLIAESEADPGRNAVILARARQALAIMEARFPDDP